MKKEDLIKQLSNLSSETQDMLLEMLIDIKHSKEGPTGNSTIDVNSPEYNELRLFGCNNFQAYEYMNYIKDSNCDQIILSAVLKYHLVKNGADSILPAQSTIDIVCKYAYELTVPQIHAVILGMSPERAKETIAGSIFDNPPIDTNGLEMNKKEVEPLVNLPTNIPSVPTNGTLDRAVNETTK